MASWPANWRDSRQVLIAALDAAAELVEHPAGAAVEVLVEQAGKRRHDRQRLVDAVEDLRLAESARRLDDDRLQPADQMPGLRRQAFADDRSRLARRARDRQRRAVALVVA